MVYNDTVNKYYVTKDNISTMSNDVKSLVNEFVMGIGDHKKCFEEVYCYNRHSMKEVATPCYSPVDEQNYAYTKRIIQDDVRDTHFEFTKRFKDYNDGSRTKWEVEVKRVSPRNGTDIIIFADIESCKYFAELLGVDL